jgi:PleD family two-component response regulator
MILAAVEDLLVRAKIQTAARRVGAEVRFVHSADELLAQARAARPSLVLIDLDSDRLRPLDMLAALATDAALAAVRTVGVVSHLRRERIAAARAAGIDDVLARSAFAARLPDLLLRAG